MNASKPPEQLAFTLRTDYIDLLQLLKATGLCATGGEAKWWVELGAITVDGEPESRKRRKLRDGNRVEITALDHGIPNAVIDVRAERPSSTTAQAT
ncbi:MAG: RNA-binding S4 domain-containing protein [Flavobacteriales bacterium]|nr:RNA-binding S4 domain-containing protein [Flavobacteriales bacterium]